MHERESKESGKDGRIFIISISFYFLNSVCNIDTIILGYRDRDPHIHGIKNKIGVISNFPNLGSTCYFQLFLCLLGEKNVGNETTCWRFFLGIFLIYFTI